MALCYTPLAIKLSELKFGCPYCGSKEISSADKHYEKEGVVQAEEYCCSKCGKVFVSLFKSADITDIYYSVSCCDGSENEDFQNPEIIEHPFMQD